MTIDEAITAMMPRLFAIGPQRPPAEAIYFPRVTSSIGTTSAEEEGAPEEALEMTYVAL